MTMVTSIGGNTAGMDRAIAGHAHSNMTLWRLDRGDATKEVLHALKECARQATRTKTTTGTIQRETPLTQPAAMARSSREPLTSRQRNLSNERASEQASGVIQVVNVLSYTQSVDGDDR